MSRVFTNGPGDRGSIPGQVIPNIQKMVHLGVVAIEKGAFNRQLYFLFISDRAYIDLS